jgi:hypothetical protein
MEPRTRGLPLSPKAREAFLASLKDGFQSAAEIQEMHNSWLYRLGGEPLYEAGCIAKGTGVQKTTVNPATPAKPLQNIPLFFNREEYMPAAARELKKIGP